MQKLQAFNFHGMIVPIYSSRQFQQKYKAIDNHPPVYRLGANDFYHCLNCNKKYRENDKQSDFSSRNTFNRHCYTCGKDARVVCPLCFLKVLQRNLQRHQRRAVCTHRRTIFASSISSSSSESSLSDDHSSDKEEQALSMALAELQGQRYPTANSISMISLPHLPPVALPLPPDRNSFAAIGMLPGPQEWSTVLQPISPTRGISSEVHLPPFESLLVPPDDASSSLYPQPTDGTKDGERAA